MHMTINIYIFDVYLMYRLHASLMVCRCRIGVNVFVWIQNHQRANASACDRKASYYQKFSMILCIYMVCL